METENTQMCNGIVDAAGENVRLVRSAEAVRLPCNGLFVEQTTVNCSTVKPFAHVALVPWLVVFFLIFGQY